MNLEWVEEAKRLDKHLIHYQQFELDDILYETATEYDPFGRVHYRIQCVSARVYPTPHAGQQAMVGVREEVHCSPAVCQFGEGKSEL